MHSLYILSIIVSLLEPSCAFYGSKAVKKIGDYPYVVSIYRNTSEVNVSTYWYTGVLLTTEWILTSAKTRFRNDDKDVEDVFAYGGTLLAFPEQDNNNFQQAKVIDIIRHPFPAVERKKCPLYGKCWYPPDNTDPMLLMKVDQKFNETDFVKPIDLPKKKEFVDKCKKMTIVGWCRDDANYSVDPASGSGILRYVPATPKSCDQEALLDDSYFCVHYDGVSQPIYTNAGQAVVCDGILIGISQSSPATAVHPDYDDTYYDFGPVSDINYYTSWIHKVTGLKVAYESTQQGLHRNEGGHASEPSKTRATTTRRTFGPDQDEENLDATLYSNGSFKLCFCNWFIIIIMLYCLFLV